MVLWCGTSENMMNAVTTNQNLLFWSCDWLSANQGPVFNSNMVLSCGTSENMMNGVTRSISVNGVKMCDTEAEDLS